MKTIGYRIEIIHPQTDKISGFTAFFKKTYTVWDWRRYSLRNN